MAVRCAGARRRARPSGTETRLTACWWAAIPPGQSSLPTMALSRALTMLMTMEATNALPKSAM